MGVFQNRLAEGQLFGWELSKPCLSDEFHDLHTVEHGIMVMWNTVTFVGTACTQHYSRTNILSIQVYNLSLSYCTHNNRNLFGYTMCFTIYFFIVVFVV